MMRKEELKQHLHLVVIKQNAAPVLPILLVCCQSKWIFSTKKINRPPAWKSESHRVKQQQQQQQRSQARAPTGTRLCSSSNPLKQQQQQRQQRKQECLKANTEGSAMRGLALKTLI